jgi:DNA polymerase-3 subunit epsilon
MAKNFWRIGVKYVDLRLFEAGYPYVWGDGVTEWGYLEYLKAIQTGDIIVAGCIEKVSFIGEVNAKPVFLFPGEDNADALFDGYGIQAASGTTDKKLIDTFLPHENDINDAVCIPVKWFEVDCAALRMPTQERSGIKPLNPAGIAYISNVLSGTKLESIDPIPVSNNLLDFTAIDFETGSGYRNSVCSVGLVKVVNGVIVESYTSLIKPPNNFIRDEFIDIHGITPEDTKYAPAFAESYPNWKRLVENQTLVAHNMQRFDYQCLTTCLKEFCGINKTFKTYCTMKTWQGEFENTRLETCCEKNGIELINHHNSLADAEACARLFILAVNTGRELRS